MAETTYSSDKEQRARIAKRIARAGLCSRRDAEKLIADGCVTVDGVVLTSPAVLVGNDANITVNGEPLAAPQKTRMWRYHKPTGLVTTHRDPQGRKTIFAAMPDDLPRVISIGRLDLTSEGLLLLTNDGDLARLLELPKTGWLRRYRVRVHGTVDPEVLKRLADGITIEGVRYGPVIASLDRVQGRNAWLTIGLHEGKNREIRRIAAFLRLDVTRLIRVAYGPFQLGSLLAGGIKEVPIRILRQQLSKAGEASLTKFSNRHSQKPLMNNE